MKLNCKPGDLALMVKSEIPENIGCILFVEEPYTGETFKSLGPAWMATLRGVWGHVLDADLRPIRDSNAPDETLQWVDVPTKQTA